MTGTELTIQTWRHNHAGRRLTGALLKEVLGVDDLCMADLSRADLSGADLAGENLYAARLTGVNARQADLSGANLCFADLSGAYLRRARLRDTYARGSNFSYAYLNDADLHGLDLSKSRLRGAMLPGILTIEGTFRGDVQLVPTPAGWHLRAGTCSGFLEELADQGAKESFDLGPIIELCHAHVARHRNLDDGFPCAQAALRPQRLVNAVA